MAHIAHERMDNVSGIVIGGDYTAWQVVYDGRTQGPKEYADTPEQAEQAGRLAIYRLKAANCGHPCYLYQDDARWTIRLWEG